MSLTVQLVSHYCPAHNHPPPDRQFGQFGFLAVTAGSNEAFMADLAAFSSPTHLRNFEQTMEEEFAVSRVSVNVPGPPRKGSSPACIGATYSGVTRMTSSVSDSVLFLRLKAAPM